jgi:hypothetical protein
MEIGSPTGTASRALAERLRIPLIGLLGGLLAGLINAVVARLLMHLVARITTGTGHFSRGGTSVIFGFAALLGPLMGLIYIALRRWLPGGVLVKALLFALILVAVFQIPVLFIVPDFRREIMAVGTLGIAVFGTINVAFCVLVALMCARLDRALPTAAGRESGIVAGALVLGLLALGGIGALVYELGGRLLGLVT